MHSACSLVSRRFSTNMSADSSDKEGTESPDGLSDDYDSVSHFQDELDTENFDPKRGTPQG